LAPAHGWGGQWASAGSAGSEWTGTAASWLEPQSRPRRGETVTYEVSKALASSGGERER